LVREGGFSLAADSVRNSELADDAVGLANVQNNSVGSLEVVNNSLTSDDLGTASVEEDELADDAVTSAKIADGTVTSRTIADGAVTTRTIADGAVTTRTIAEGAVTSYSIADYTIQSEDIADGAITERTLSSSLRSRLDRVDSGVRTANKGVSMAFAMANVPQLTQGKDHSVGIALGHFEGETSIAIGMNARLDANVVGRFSVSGSGNNTWGAGAGLAFEYSLDGLTKAFDEIQ
jgi:autotransporter adhesin